MQKPTLDQLQRIAYCEEVLLRQFNGESREDAEIWLRLNWGEARRLDYLQRVKRNRKGKAYWKGVPQQQRLMGYQVF